MTSKRHSQSTTKSSQRNRDLPHESRVALADSASAWQVRWNATTAGGVLAILALACYWNALGAAFVFDMDPVIESPLIRQLWPPGYLFLNGRLLGNLTFSLNYAWSGERPWSYVLANLVFHWLAACVLYYAVREVLRIGPVSERVRLAASGLALAVAAAWLVHPLQTNVVTNVVQRYESLMGLFYLLSFACFLRAQQTARPARWYVLSVSCVLLGLGCKEVIATAPLVILCFDAVYVARGWRELVRRRWLYYLGLAATWLWFAAMLWRISPGLEKSGIGMVSDPYSANPGNPDNIISPWRYLLTQAEVIPYYLFLSIWPQRLSIDYGWPFAESLSEVLLPGLFVCGLLLASGWLLVRRSLLGFAGVWFFFILAPTSTVLPIVDAVFEHRLYLPLAALLVVFVVGGYELALRGASYLSLTTQARIPSLLRVLLIVYTAGLGLGTLLRNKDYANPLHIYQQAISYNPRYSRPYYNAAVVLRDQGNMGEALSYIQGAIALKPTDCDSRICHAEILLAVGRPREAAQELQRATELNQKSAVAYNNLGLATMANKGDPKEAERYFRRALEIDPALREAQVNLKEVNRILGLDRNREM